jgi:hypothetical protein
MDFKKLTDYLKLTTPYVEPTEIKAGDTEVTEPKGRVRQEPVDEIFSWSVELEPYKIPKKILRSAFVFVFLFSIFLVLAQEWNFLLLILGLVFVVNILTKSKDKNILKYTLYTNGIDYCGTFYTWDELSIFFYHEGKTNEIIINSLDSLPGRIYVIFEDKDREKIDSVLNKYLTKSLVHPKDFFELIIYKIKPYLNLSDEK